MDIHTPERGANETQAQYRERQAASRAAVKTMTKGPTQAPAISQTDTSRFWLGQHTNDERNAKRSLVKACGGRRQYLKATKRMRHA